MRMNVVAMVFAALVTIVALPATARTSPDATVEVRAESLPREARATIEQIQKGGPFPYARDGIVFSNREGQLPAKKRGYYHEYTVKTPGARTRGARRIIAGRDGELYYTDDHYATFRRVRD